jgi:hypothetical protein
VLFAAVAVARAYGVDPEMALQGQCEAFLASLRRDCEPNSKDAFGQSHFKE